jgi:hypothetical protein
MKITIFIFAAISLIMITTVFATDNSNVQYRDLTNKLDVYNYLFIKHFELQNPNCHRQVHESRSPKTMIAMGCELYRLEIDKSSIAIDKIQFTAHYQCGENQFPFTAHCYLK